MQEYSDKEHKALLNFVTSTDSNIYAVKNLRPEVFGAFGSFFSRSPKDVRDHILDAVKGEIRGYEMEGGEERLNKLATSYEFLQKRSKLDSGEDSGGIKQELKDILNKKRGVRAELEASIFEPPMKALESGLEKSQSFFEKYYGTYGHKSIANTVWISFVANDVSQLFARKLADDQLAFFIEQSTRFVEFEDNYYKDPRIMESEYSDLYNDTLETMIEYYNKFYELANNFYQEKIPFNDWLDQQSDRVKEKSDSYQERKYERELNGKALDIARFLLPQAIKTNLAWILDARSTEFDIASWKGHPLSEIQESAEKIEQAGGEIAPSLLKYTEKNDFYEEKLHEYGGDLELDLEDKEIEKGVEIVSTPEDCFEKVVAHILKQNNIGKFSQFFQKAKNMTYDEKLDILERTVKNRGEYDEWVGANEEIDLEKIVVEIKTDVGALRDIRRHQKNDRGEHRYSLDMGYYRPDVVDKMNKEAQNLFDKTMDIAHEAEKEIRKDFPFAVQYLIPMASMTTITMSMGFDQLQYFIYTRSTPEGNFSYREDTFNLTEALVKKFPWLLGMKEYPEDKDIKEVYDNCSWQDLFISLSTDETGLHT
ncbi:MAG: FAD-dependent thymidylate synthase [Candidatus Magasanikbacteria bacterium]